MTTEMWTFSFPCAFCPNEIIPDRDIYMRYPDGAHAHWDCIRAQEIEKRSLWLVKQVYTVNKIEFSKWKDGSYAMLELAPPNMTILSGKIAINYADYKQFKPLVGQKVMIGFQNVKDDVT